MPGRIADEVKLQPPGRWRWTRYAAAVIAAWMLACVALPPLAFSPQSAFARQSSTSDDVLFWDRALRHDSDRAWVAQMCGILIDPDAHLDWWVLNGRLQVRIYGDGPNPIALELWIPDSGAPQRYPVLIDTAMPF